MIHATRPEKSAAILSSGVCSKICLLYQTLEISDDRPSIRVSLVSLAEHAYGRVPNWSSITAAKIQTVRHQWRASPTSLIRGARPSTYAGLKQTESLRQPGRTDTKRRACRKLVLTGQKKPPASLPIRLKTDRKQSDDRVSRIDGSQIVCTCRLANIGVLPLNDSSPRCLSNRQSVTLR